MGAEKGYAGIKARAVYDALAVENKKLTPTLFHAFKAYVDDIEFQALLETDISIMTAVVTKLQTVTEMLTGVLENLKEHN